jgi:EAL domain-containing protein (putative c-di-GMP-specific phosphodiesterase class I)
MLKHLHQDRSKTDTPLSLVLLQQHITPSEFHLAAAQALKLKAYLESHNRPEFFEAPQDINAKLSSVERERLRKGLINNDIRLSTVNTLKDRDDLPSIKELKLLWHDETQPEKTAEELIIALENLGLSNTLVRIQSTQLLPMIKLGQDRSSVDNIALLAPEKILLNLANFSAMSSLLMDSDIVPERLWLRIHESSANQLLPEHWQSLQDLKSKGFKFMLGEVGAGDTDIKLLAHPLFDMAHFSRTMTKAAAESTRASLIFEAGLQIAQSLNLLTMAKAVNEPLYINYLQESGVDYIDIA